MNMSSLGKIKDTSLPIRPHLSIILICALLFWAGSAGLVYIAPILPEDMLRLCFILCCIGSCIGIFLFSKVKRFSIVIGLAFLFLGIVLGSSSELHQIALLQQLKASNPEGNLQVSVTEDSKHNDYESSFVGSSLISGKQILVKVSYSSSENYFCGEKLTVVTSSITPVTSLNTILWQKGITLRCRALDIQNCPLRFPLQQILNMRKKVIASFEPYGVEGQLMQAIVCGWRTGFSETKEYAAFKSSGLAHLVAVSGAHLVIVCSLIQLALKKLKLPRHVTTSILIIFIGVYFVLAGEPISALRAAIMSVIACTSFVSKRRPATLNAIGITLFAMLAIDPRTALSLSFALSCASTLGIVMFASLFISWLNRTPLHRIPFVSDALGLCLASWVTAQPLSVALFSQMPLVAPLANIAIAPFFPLLCGGGLLFGIVSLLAPFVTVIMAPVIRLPYLLTCILVSTLADIPYACIPFHIDCLPALVLSFSLSALLYFTWPISPKRIGLVVVCLLLGILLVPTNFAKNEIALLDVGQGDAILIRSNNSTLLIDTGNQDSKLISCLADKRIYHLDGVLITHADDDHCGSLDALASCVEVDTIYLAKDALSSSTPKIQSLLSEASECTRSLVGLSYGDVISLGSFTAQVIWPHAFTEDGGNADSLCLLGWFDDNDDGDVEVSALFTGDAEKNELEQMISKGDVANVDILKVGHHGSKNGMNKSQVSALHPRIALIGVGAHNRYGHPSKEIISLLTEINALIYRTDMNSTVTLSIIGNTVTCTPNIE